MLIIAVVVIMLVLFGLKSVYKKTSEPSAAKIQSSSVSTDAAWNKEDASNNAENIQTFSGFVLPLDKARERVIKKPFEIHVDSKNSPVQPEMFSGYHTGTDFEAYPSEQDIDIPVYAIVSGKILTKEWANGYGGVLVESASINGNLATIIYGHLKLDSIDKKSGDSLDAGEQIGILGKGYSRETDGERKHLHLGIKKGNNVNILGYVKNKNDLVQWIDPMTIIP